MSPLPAGAAGRPVARRPRRGARQHTRSTSELGIRARGPLAGAALMAARDDTISSAQVRHEQAVARTLDWSDQAAEDGDAANALTWLQALEAIGDPLSDDYQKKRQAWRRALRLDRKHRERRARSRRRCTSGARACSRRAEIALGSTASRHSAVGRAANAASSADAALAAAIAAFENPKEMQLRAARTFQRKVDRAERNGDADAARWHLWALGRSLYSAEVAVEALREIRAKRDIPSPPSPATASDPRIAQIAGSG